MENNLSIQEGEQLVLKGEDYLVRRVTNLGTEDVHVTGFRQWGTHILTLERIRDGRCFAATRYASGVIGLPFPFTISGQEALRATGEQRP